MEQFRSALNLLPMHIWLRFTPTQAQGEPLDPRVPLPSTSGSPVREPWAQGMPLSQGVWSPPSPRPPQKLWEVRVQNP